SPCQSTPRTSSWNACARSSSSSQPGFFLAKLYFYYSTMNAGKSTALLQASHNYEERGMRTLLYTAQIDSRDGGRIASRIGIEREALHFAPGQDLMARVTAEHERAALACVLVDESQFL